MDTNTTKALLEKLASDASTDALTDDQVNEIVEYTKVEGSKAALLKQVGHDKFIQIFERHKAMHPFDYAKEISIDSFTARYAPEAFDLNDPDYPAYETPHKAVMDRLSSEDAQLLADLLGPYTHDGFRIRVDNYGSNTANDIRNQSGAADEIERLNETEKKLQEALKQVQALRRYYQINAAMLAVSVKNPCYVLSRNSNQYNNGGKVKYTIEEGYYDETLKRFVITNYKLEEYEGKQHREARARFAQLVKDHPGSRGYETNNGWTDSIKVDHPVIS